MSRRFPWLGAINLLIFLFLFAPIAIVIGTSFTSSTVLSFPPRGFSLRWYQEIGHQQDFIQAFQISLLLALISTLISGALGLLASLGLVRYRFPGRELINTIVMSPLIVPGMVSGIAMLTFFTMVGIGPNFGRLVAGHVVLTLPYVVRVTMAVLQGYDIQVEEAAASLGAHPLRTLWRVTLPIIKPGLVAGMIFAFLVSFDNVVITVFLSTPLLTTLPVKIYGFLESNGRPIIAAISSVQVVIVAVGLLVLERVVGFSRNF